MQLLACPATVLAKAGHGIHVALNSFKRVIKIHCFLLRKENQKIFLRTYTALKTNYISVVISMIDYTELIIIGTMP